MGECLDQLHSLHLVCVKRKAVQIAKIKRVCTPIIGRNPSPDLEWAISEDPDVFGEQIRKLLFKWHVLIVRVVRESEQRMFREVWSVYTGHVQMKKLLWSRDIRASSQVFYCRLFRLYVRTVRTQAGLHICHYKGHVQQGGNIFPFISFCFMGSLKSLFCSGAPSPPMGSVWVNVDFVYSSGVFKLFHFSFFKFDFIISL